MKREVGMLEALASALKSASHTADVIYSQAPTELRKRLDAALDGVDTFTAGKAIEELFAECTHVHIHVASRDGTDRCALCGLDLRDEIHERAAT